MSFLKDDIVEHYKLWQDATGRSPITDLKEFCADRRFDLNIEEEKVDVSEFSHPKFFRFAATVGHHVVTGTGTSKRKAKRFTAFKMLAELQYQSEDTAGEKELDYILADARTNPVEDLEHLTRQLFLPSPIYEILMKRREDLLKEERELLSTKRFQNHVCVVKVNEYIVRVIGLEGKKKAKRAGAERMLKLLKSLPIPALDLDGNTTSNQTSDPSINHSDQLLSTNCSEAPSIFLKLPCNWSDLVKKAELYSQLCCEVPVKSADNDSDHIIDKLNSIAEVEYINLDENTVNGEHQCLVRVLSSPLLVFYGLSDSTEGAQQAAARHALEYLRENLHIGPINSR